MIRPRDRLVQFYRATSDGHVFGQYRRGRMMSSRVPYRFYSSLTTASRGIAARPRSRSPGQLHPSVGSLPLDFENIHKKKSQTRYQDRYFNEATTKNNPPVELSTNRSSSSSPVIASIARSNKDSHKLETLRRRSSSPLASVKSRLRATRYDQLASENSPPAAGRLRSHRKTSTDSGDSDSGGESSMYSALSTSTVMTKYGGSGSRRSTPTPRHRMSRLRSRYEEELLSLQEELKKDKKVNMEQYNQLMSQFREHLGEVDKGEFDSIISKMNKAHQNELEELKNDNRLEMLALKTTMGAVYTSKSQLDLQAIEERLQRGAPGYGQRLDQFFTRTLSHFSRSTPYGYSESLVSAVLIIFVAIFLVYLYDIWMFLFPTGRSRVL